MLIIANIIFSKFGQQSVYISFAKKTLLIVLQCQIRLYAAEQL